MPSGGEVLESDDVTLTVDQVVGRRITKVRAKRNHNKPLIKDEKNAHE